MTTNIHLLGVDVYFTEESYVANEAELRIPVTVGKNRKIATPLVVRLTPLDVTHMVNGTVNTPQQCFYMCSCTCQATILNGKLL